MSRLKHIKFEEDKFIVINKKYLDRLLNQQREDLADILDTLDCDNRYLVVNQDESYAPKILAIILQEEELKQIGKIK